MYNNLCNNHENHITISHKIHKSEIITKQLPRGIISSYPDLNGWTMTYYLDTTMPQSYTYRHENNISYLIISVHGWSNPQRTKMPKHTASSLYVCSNRLQRPHHINIIVTRERYCPIIYKQRLIHVYMNIKSYYKSHFLSI